MARPRRRSCPIAVLTATRRASTLRAVALDDALTPAAATGAADALERTTDEDDTGPLYCYRHPKSETYVRCGRCDQPICPKCAVQGPVGFRCRQCGLVKNASIRDFSPRQLVFGVGVAFGGGALLGYFGGQIGFFSIFLSFFAGSFIAEGVVRFMGLKRGPVMRTIVYGGLLAGLRPRSGVPGHDVHERHPARGRRSPGRVLAAVDPAVHRDRRRRRGRGRVFEGSLVLAPHPTQAAHSGPASRSSAFRYTLSFP